MSGTGDKLKCVVSFNFFSRGPNNQASLLLKENSFNNNKIGKVLFY